MKKRILFVNAIPNEHSARLVGDNIDALVNEAMKYVIRSREFYERAIRTDLESRGNSTISVHSCSLSSGLFIYYDPQENITDNDAISLSGRDMYMKFEKQQPNE